MLTLQEMLNRYLEHHLSRKPSYAYARRMVRQHFRDWQQHPTQDDLREWHASRSSTPIHANKALILLGSAYNWARRQHIWDGDNPARGITRYPSQSRERVMSYRELSMLRDSLPLLPAKYAAYLSVLVYTGCRMSEARVMRWIDLEDDGRWTKGRTKNGRAHVSFLPPVAMQRVQALPRLGEFVFPGFYGRPLSRAGAEKAWCEFRPLMGLQGIWLHDFRRTIATYLYTELGVDELGVKAVLGHYDKGPIAHYVRLNFDFLARTLLRYADWVAHVTPTQGHSRHHSAPLVLEAYEHG